jgi:hypothetical protein
MTNFTGKPLQDQFKDAFGKSIEELTPQQIQWIVQFAKHVRGRCRSNNALRNYLNLNFTGHSFKEVDTTFNGKPWKKLTITSKKTNETVEDNEES